MMVRMVIRMLMRMRTMLLLRRVMRIRTRMVVMTMGMGSGGVGVGFARVVGVEREACGALDQGWHGGLECMLGWCAGI